MNRFAVASVGAGAGSTTLPSFSIYAAAGAGFFLRRLRVFNTTAVAVRLKLARLSTLGTPGTGLTEQEFNAARVDPLATAYAAHTVAPTVSGDVGACSLGAAIGSVCEWRWEVPEPGAEHAGLYVPPGVTNGIGLIVSSGTGQVLDVEAGWDE